MNKLSLINKTKNKFRYEKEFKQIIKSFSKILNYKEDINVDVLITNNEEVKEISKKYRNINKETDVLSFPFEFNELSSQLGFNFLGEIVLSYEKVEEQSREFNHSLKREFCYLFAHGLVHLSGRDHKKSKKEEKEFNDIVDQIMNEVNIQRD